MYYNPYYMASPVAKAGLFGNLFRGINFSSILNGTQRTLNIINQTIPVVKQVSPLVKNGKTLFKLMSEFNKQDTSTNNKNVSNTQNTNNNPESNKEDNKQDNYSYSEESPTFFQ